MENTILSVQNITKTYPGVIALNDVSIDFFKGEIHGLVGENGAGKSTLIKVISGAIEPDNGYIEFEGQKFTKITPQVSLKHGIEVVYQEFNLIPSLSIAENLFIGNYLGNGITVSFKEMEKRSVELFESMKVKINPRAKVETLSVAYMQIVEIAKAIIKDVKLLIMDEPTAPLTTSEVEILFELTKNLKERGVSVIYISHRLNEIFRITDRVTVMRDGHKIITKETKDTTRQELINLMVGHKMTESFPPRKNAPGDVVLEVKNLSGDGVRDISFQVRRGEILGFSGLLGAGRTETVRMLFGADTCERGEIFINGKATKIHHPRDAVKQGIALVPEDRKQQGLLLGLSVKNNITLPILHQISRLLIINEKHEQEIAINNKDSLQIKTPSLDQLVMNLSGGNQQKVVLSKWLASGAKILIFDEPTRGIDVGAKQEIYRLMNKLAEEGNAIIMISSELEEILGMADRVIVLAEGEMMGELKKEEFSQERILELASGIH